MTSNQIGVFFYANSLGTQRLPNGVDHSFF